MAKRKFFTVNMVKQNQYVNSFYSKVFSLINDCGKLPSYERLGMTKSNLYYHIRKLKSLNILVSIEKGSGVYKMLCSEKEAFKRLNRRVKQKIKHLSKTKKKTYNKFKRLHAIQFSLLVPRYYFWKKSILKYLEKKKIDFEFTNNNRIKLIFKYDNKDYILHICKESIMLFFPSEEDFISDNRELTRHLAIGRARVLFSAIGRYLCRDLRIKGNYQIKMGKHELSIMNSDLAKKLHKERKELRVFIDGKLRLITDKSFNWDEEEAVSSKNTFSDIKKLEDFYSDFLTHGITIGDLNRKQEELIMTTARQMKLIEDQQELINHLIEKEQKSINIDKFKY